MESTYRVRALLKSDIDSSSSDGEILSSDTDDEVFKPNKKMKLDGSGNQNVSLPPIEDVRSSKHKNNIWTKVLSEQNAEELATSIGHVGMMKTVSRGPESFYRPRFKRRDRASDNELSRDAAMQVDTCVQNKIKNFSLNQNQQATKNPRKRNFGSKRQIKTKPENASKNVPEYSMGQKVKLNKRQEFSRCTCIDETATELAFRLWEKKKCLVKNLVEFVGVEKAISIYLKVESVEANGGMATMKGNRRRTPGGVFIHFLQTDEDIDKEKLQVFHRLSHSHLTP